MDKFEYIKWFWKHNYNDTPILLFYEIDLENERYATRIPTIDEINLEPEFFAVISSKEEFENVYKSEKYAGEINFPK